MKSLIIFLAGLLVLFLGGLKWQDGVDVPIPESVQMVGQAQSIDQISGIWHGFPSGLLLQINEDGSAQFGQDMDGALIGYSAVMRFRNQQLYVQFSDYSGLEESCQTAIGSYIVQIHESGAIHFEPVQDDCLFRLKVLRGQSDSGMLYHRFDMDY